MDILINKLLNESMSRGAVDPDQIPDLDLYIDQIIMLIEKAVGQQPDGQLRAGLRTCAYEGASVSRDNSR